VCKRPEASAGIDDKDMPGIASWLNWQSFGGCLNAVTMSDSIGTPSTKVMSITARARASSRPGWSYSGAQRRQKSI